jgi:hypothetical protein
MAGKERAVRDAGAVSSVSVEQNADWRRGLRVYLSLSAAGHLVWEAAHVRLYTIWTTQPPAEIASAILHCTAGDVLIAATALLVPLLTLPRATEWPHAGAASLRVAITALILGLAYTFSSEWWNVEVRRAWQYAPNMPRVLPLGTGLTPLLQWLVVPTLALAAASFAARRPRGRAPSR